MLQKDFDNKISTLLGLRENVDVVPPQETIPVTALPTSEPVSLPSSDNGNITELLKKQTELIELIKTQNELIQKLLEIKQNPLPPPSPVIQQSGFVEKIINLKFDERGNPVGAEILAKPTYEDTLDLDELESQAHLALKIDLPTTEGNN